MSDKSILELAREHDEMVGSNVRLSGRRASGGNAAWPLNCDALGVHPKQIQDAIHQARRLGVPTDFTPDGRAILTGRGHRKRLLKALRFHDRDGGYGD